MQFFYSHFFVIKLIIFRVAINPPAAAIAPTLMTSPSSHFNIGVVAPTASLLPNYDPRLAQTAVKLIV